MGIFDSLSGGQKIQNGSRMQSQRRMTPIQMLMQLKRDPASVLRQAGYNIPSNVQDRGDGSGYMEYLYQTGQIGNGELQMIQNAVSGGRKR